MVPPNPKDTNPSVSGGKPGEEAPGENSERNPSLASLTQPALYSLAFQVVYNFLAVFFVFVPPFSAVLYFCVCFFS